MPQDSFMVAGRQRELYNACSRLAIELLSAGARVELYCCGYPDGTISKNIKENAPTDDYQLMLSISDEKPEKLFAAAIRNRLEKAVKTKTHHFIIATNFSASMGVPSSPQVMDEYLTLDSLAKKKGIVLILGVSEKHQYLPVHKMTFDDSERHGLPGVLCSMHHKLSAAFMHELEVFTP